MMRGSTSTVVAIATALSLSLLSHNVSPLRSVSMRLWRIPASLEDSTILHMSCLVASWKVGQAALK